MNKTELKRTSFHLAVLFKKIGFDLQTPHFWELDSYNKPFEKVSFSYMCNNEARGARKFSSPELELAKTWLREEFDIDIFYSRLSRKSTSKYEFEARIYKTDISVIGEYNQALAMILQSISEKIVEKKFPKKKEMSKWMQIWNRIVKAIQMEVEVKEKQIGGNVLFQY